MIVESVSRKEIVLRAQTTRKEGFTQFRDETWKSFIFQIGIIPLKPTPKKIVIRRGRMRWEMTWKKFLGQTCLDGTCLIDKGAFKYRFV